MSLHEWVTASQVRNYFLKDPILDWLDRYGEKFGFARDEKKTEFDFHHFIQKKGIEFEKKVYEALGVHPLLPFKKNVIQHEQDLDEWFSKTLEKLHGHDVVAQGLLIEKNQKYWGIPDLIVRLSWLTEYYHDDLAIFVPDVLKLPNKEDYFIVGDIKYTTLKSQDIDQKGDVKAVKKWIRNHKYYVAQLWLYYKMLASTKNTLPFGFLMLRDPVPVSMGDVQGHILVIDFNSDVVQAILPQVNEAINWLRTLSKEDFEYRIGEHPHLFPNMSNKDDFPWHEAKKQIAHELNELTQLWFLSPDVRNKLHAKGIKTCKALADHYFHDSSILHLLFKSKGQRYKAFRAVLEANYGEKPFYFPKNLDIEKQWYPKNPNVKEFYVDYETFSGINDPFTSFPSPNYSNLIFMIGVGEERNGSWEFTCFIAKENTLLSEKQVLLRFFKFLEDRTRESKKEDFVVYHWANHEKSELIKAGKRHNMFVDTYLSRFIDLEKIFEKQPIGVKGALTFSIKAVAPALKELGCIKTAWPEGGLADGLSAMIGAWHAYEQAQQNKTSIEENSIMREIKDYNEIDCKVMYEILKWMRTYRSNMQ